MPQLNATVEVQSSILSADQTAIVMTFTQSLTQVQLTAQLVQLMNQSAALGTQKATVDKQISALQSQLSLFPLAPITVDPAQDQLLTS